LATLLGKGVYGFPEAARLARIDVNNARRWFLGRRDYPASGPVLRSDVPSVRGKHAISFLDLIDLLVVGRFREHGVPMQTVRKVYGRLRERLGSAHPFSHYKLKSDGRTVFLEVVDDLGDRQLEEVLSGQAAMPRVLDRYLKDIEYGRRTQIAERWNVSPGVVIDPTKNFGKPTAVEAGASTFVLARAFHANGQNAELVADLFATSPQAVLDAVEFEERIGNIRAA